MGYTGQFTAQIQGRYHYAVAATAGGMLPPKEGDSLLVQSPVYAQIFLRHNGIVREVAGDEERESALPYLLVTEEEVGSLEDTILLEEGDTLELVTGHVTTGKPSRLHSIFINLCSFFTGMCMAEKLKWFPGVF